MVKINMRNVMKVYAGELNEKNTNDFIIAS